MTWEQIQLFADKAGERISQNLLTSVGSEATAIGVALSGDVEPLKKMARELGVRFDLPVSSDGGVGAKVGTAVRELASSGQVRFIGGSDGRRVERRARRPNARVPRRTPPG